MTREEKEQLRDGVTDRVALIGTLMGEAAGESIAGQVAVASVIRNRALHPRWWGKSWRGVCLQRGQFSCWWEANANTDRVYALARALMTGQAATSGPDVVSQLEWVAAGVLDNVLMDPTGMSDHYLTETLFESAACPVWARGKRPKARIDHHVFLRLEL